MPGTFALAIIADRGWTSPQLYLGLTLAMLVMAAVSLCRPSAGTLWRAKRGDEWNAADRRKLRGDGIHPDPSRLVQRRLVTGIGMRLSLYDALFAALVNLYGQQARKRSHALRWLVGWRLLFWPLGDTLLKVMSWQHALQIYALLDC